MLNRQQPAAQVQHDTLYFANFQEVHVVSFVKVCLEGCSSKVS